MSEAQEPNEEQIKQLLHSFQLWDGERQQIEQLVLSYVERNKHLQHESEQLKVDCAELVKTVQAAALREAELLAAPRETLPILPIEKDSTLKLNAVLRVTVASRRELQLRLSVRRGGKMLVGTGLFMTELDPGQRPPPTLTLSVPAAQQLMDDLWQAGLRSTEEGGVKRGF